MNEHHRRRLDRLLNPVVASCTGIVPGFDLAIIWFTYPLEYREAFTNAARAFEADYEKLSPDQVELRLYQMENLLIQLTTKMHMGTAEASGKEIKRVLGGVHQAAKNRTDTAEKRWEPARS